MSRDTALFLLNNLGMGGSERKTVSVINQLHSRGYGKIHLAYLNPPETLLVNLGSNVDVLLLDRQGKVDIRLAKRLAAYIDNHRVCCVWAVNLYPLLYAFLGRHFARSSFRIIASTNTTEFENMREAAQMIIYAPLLRRSDKIVFGSNQQRGAWLDKYKIAPERSLTVYNGVDTEHFRSTAIGVERHQLSDSLGLPESAFYIGMVAQFRPEKAHTDLLVAFKQLSLNCMEAHLVLVGEGPERANTERQAEELGISQKVHFLGLMNDVRPVLALLNVFVLSSTSVETFSNAALEAMAMSVPVVLSDISGAGEMVEDGKSGLLFPPGDVNALTKALVSLLDSDYRMRIARAARERVESQFSVKRMIDAYEVALDLDRS